MTTYTTLEEIKAGQQAVQGDSTWELRPEQREAIDCAKNHFCKRSGRMPDYKWTVLTGSRSFFGTQKCALARRSALCSSPVKWM